MEQKLNNQQLRALFTAITYLTAREGKARNVTLASYLLAQYKGLFTKDWCGYRKFREMFDAYPEFFEIYGDSSTDKLVRIVAGANSISDSPESDIDLNPENFMRKFITRQFAKEICEEFRLGDGLEDYCVFLNYLIYTYYISEAQGKVLKGGNMRMFHTGLFFNDTDPIYMLWGYDHNNLAGRTFIRRSGRGGREAIRLFGNKSPELAEFPYMEFDPNLHIEPEFGHILDERAGRLPKETIEMLRHSPNIPEDSRNQPDEEIVRISRNFLRRLLDGCINDTRTRLKNRRDEAVLFWYKRTNKMCWLIPLRLGITDEPNLALVLEPSTLNDIPVYRAHTILALKEAFKCARLLGPVGAKWLCDAWKN